MKIIENKEKNSIELQLNVAGFSKDDLKITADAHFIWVEGKRNDLELKKEIVLAKSVSNYEKISATVEHGLLTISLYKKLPITISIE